MAFRRVNISKFQISLLRPFPFWFWLIMNGVTSLSACSMKTVLGSNSFLVDSALKRFTYSRARIAYREPG